MMSNGSLSLPNTGSWVIDHGGTGEDVAFVAFDIHFCLRRLLRALAEVFIPIVTSLCECISYLATLYTLYPIILIVSLVKITDLFFNHSLGYIIVLSATRVVRGQLSNSLSIYSLII